MFIRERSLFHLNCTNVDNTNKLDSVMVAKSDGKQS